jgi:hypothetical protein
VTGEAAFAKANAANILAQASFTQANAAYANANTAIYTAAQIRANISNTTPINYDASTGIISHAVSGVANGVYGTVSAVPHLTIDDYGHINAAVNFTISIGASQITSGQLVPNRGGTGTIAPSVNGQILIANTVSSAYDIRLIGQTAPIIVTNGQGTINLSHAASGVTATGYANANTIPVFVVDTFGHLTSVTNTAIGNLDTATITTGRLVVARGGTGLTPTIVNGAILISNTVNSGFDLNTIANTGTGGILITNGQGTITLAANVIWMRGNVSNTAPVNYDPSTGIISLAT